MTKNSGASGVSEDIKPPSFQRTQSAVVCKNAMARMNKMQRYFILSANYINVNS